MDVIVDISFSPRASGSHLRRSGGLEQFLEQLVLSLEDAAFRLLAHENHAYIAGEFEEVMKFAKWRSEIRLAADALCMVSANSCEMPGPRTTSGRHLAVLVAPAERFVAPENGRLSRDVEMAQRASSRGRLSGQGPER